MIGLMVTFSKRTYANLLCLPRRLLPVLLSPQQATADPCLYRKLAQASYPYPSEERQKKQELQAYGLQNENHNLRKQ